MDLNLVGQNVDVAIDNIEHILNEWKTQPTNYHVGFKSNEIIDSLTDELEIAIRAYRDKIIQLELKEEEQWEIMYSL